MNPARFLRKSSAASARQLVPPSPVLWSTDPCSAGHPDFCASASFHRSYEQLTARGRGTAARPSRSTSLARASSPPGGCSCRQTSRRGTASSSQADVTLKVEVRVVDLLHAADLGGLVWVVGVDGEGEVEAAALVHT